MAWTGYSGGYIGDMLLSWEQSGVFDYILPFLLIFAIIFAILTRLKVFEENRSINAIISLVIGLMALQFDFVPLFFAELFPRLGVGLAVLLVVMVFLGMFAPNKTWVTYTFFAVAALILIAILGSTAGVFGVVNAGFLGSIYWPDLVPIIMIVVVIAIVVISSRPATKPEDVSSNFMSALFPSAGGKKKL